MAHCKPIKFFLRIGNDKAHDLESLREHFHLDLVYDLYTHGILARWLDVHGYKEEKAALDTFEHEFHHSELNNESAKKFCKIFFPDADKILLGGIIETFKLYKKWRDESKKIAEMKGQFNTDINEYHLSYSNLKESIIGDRYNMPAIKLHLLELSYRYFNLFSIDHKACLDFFEEKSLIAILMMFANRKLRDFLAQDIELWNRYIKLIHNAIPKDPGDDPAKYALKEFIFPSTESKIVSNIKYTSKYTQEMWDDIEPHENKEYMILQCTSNQSVRPYRVQGGELSPKTLQDFPIIKGIDYRSKSELNFLIYMEV